MAELEKLKSDEKMYKSFGNLKISIEKALEGSYNDVKDIEGSATSETGV
jgi:chaperonin cofactor prefoldin